MTKNIVCEVYDATGGGTTYYTKMRNPYDTSSSE